MQSWAEASYSYVLGWLTSEGFVLQQCGYPTGVHFFCCEAKPEFNWRGLERTHLKGLENGTYLSLCMCVFATLTLDDLKYSFSCEVRYFSFWNSPVHIKFVAESG